MYSRLAFPQGTRSEEKFRTSPQSRHRESNPDLNLTKIPDCHYPMAA